MVGLIDQQRWCRVTADYGGSVLQFLHLRLYIHLFVRYGYKYHDQEI